ncbi:HAMP domain-containing histidine kinase [Synechococcus sp. PCC 6717]|nr:HAMP domain-containing histidine kinase [Synechococcus sp. PCC 6717]
MDHLYLQTFGEVAVTVAMGLPLAEVHRLWQETLPEIMIIVDNASVPIGVVHGWRLALSLSYDGTVATLPVGRVSGSWRSPLTTLPATWSLRQFQHWVSQQAQIPAYIALVDEQQRFVSLLDQQRLLHYWAGQPHLPWVEVLAQLPLPLQIQASNGSVLWQNTAWLTHLGTTPAAQQQLTGMSCQQVGERSPWQLCSVPLYLSQPEVATLNGETAPAIATVASAVEPYWLFFAQAASHLTTTPPNRINELRLLQQKRFLLSLGHELKNPLTAVLSLTQLLWQTSQPQQQDYVALIQRSGWQMNRLIQAWQDYTRALWREMELQWEAVELANLWFRAHELAGHLYEAQFPDLSLQWQIDISLADIYLYGDALRLRHIFAHLIGWVALSRGDRRGVRLCQWQEWLVVQLWEEGGGIPLTYHERLLHQCLEDYAEVTMGLMLAHQLTRLHNGELSFIAQPDQYSEWSVLLPLASDLSIPVPNARHIILLVSNDAEWLMTVVKALKQQDYGYVVARQPLEALDKLEQLHPSAIVIRAATGLVLAEVTEVLTSADHSETIPMMIIADESPPCALPGLVQQLPTQSSTALLMEVLERWCYPRLNPVAANPPSHEPASTQTVLGLGLSRELPLPYVRLLEADDLEQADLVADIWQPDVLIWDLPLIQVPRLADHPKLMRLPIITLDEEISRALHSLGNTLVFPCLDLADLVAVVSLAATVKPYS